MVTGRCRGHRRLTAANRAASKTRHARTIILKCLCRIRLREAQNLQEPAGIYHLLDQRRHSDLLSFRLGIGSKARAIAETFGRIATGHGCGAGRCGTVPAQSRRLGAQLHNPSRCAQTSRRQLGLCCRFRVRVPSRRKGSALISEPSRGLVRQLEGRYLRDRPGPPSDGESRKRVPRLRTVDCVFGPKGVALTRLKGERRGQANPEPKFVCPCAFLAPKGGAMGLATVVAASELCPSFALGNHLALRHAGPSLRSEAAKVE